MCAKNHFKENHNNLKDSRSKRVRFNHRDAKIFLKSAKIYDKLVTIDGSLVELFGHRSISRRKSGARSLMEVDGS